MTEKLYSEIFNVTHNDCISEIDNSLPSLLGTYTLVKWMEIVSAKNINRQLDKQYITVGQKVSIEHIGMVRIDENVQVISTIEKRDKRNVSFTLEAIANGKLIATASHNRIVIAMKVIDKVLKS